MHRIIDVQGKYFPLPSRLSQSSRSVPEKRDQRHHQHDLVSFSILKGVESICRHFAQCFRVCLTNPRVSGTNYHHVSIQRKRMHSKHFKGRASLPLKAPPPPPSSPLLKIAPSQGAISVISVMSRNIIPASVSKVFPRPLVSRGK